ncbi:FtsX-like permease family protein [Corynebacterium sp. zg-331]|uniref:ABC transporter permease n=1 Tax=unclassified Corynebacterium TaxID=2624378 RepID=UPI00128AF175|nr:MULTISPECIES: ABC transporter permease [unclassified Corynebacterium]MBC3186521.1 FtsX-like permease family protein [Corynebacterium sp. zg-331]MPV53006.1 FtsX-like permease family protein [Corynebacterium sp. zg331]
MFLALRDIRRAWGRFSLLGTVVALIVLLLVMLTGLTGGLGKQNTSALEALGPQRYVLSPTIDFAESTVSEDVANAWRKTPGVEAVTPLGVSQTSAHGDETTAAVAVLGLPAGSRVPGGGEVPGEGVLLPESIDASGSGFPERLSMGGVNLPVAGLAPEEYYSHLPVAWVSLETWKKVSHSSAPTVLMVDGTPGDAWANTARATGSEAVSVRESFAGLAAYQSERGSLLSIQGLLYGISALVILAFLSVWTIQRTRDIAVLRALGASKGYVLRDSLGQAALVLSVGVAVGAGLAAGLGLIARRVVPFELSVTTVAAPAAGVLALGLVGAWLATRKVAAVDPQMALNS